MVPSRIARGAKLLGLAIILGSGASPSGVAAQPVFKTPRLFRSLDFPSRIEAADFNGDGRTEVVVIDSRQGEVGVHSPGAGGGLPLRTSRRLLPGSPAAYFKDMTLARLDPGPVPEIERRVSFLYNLSLHANRDED
jgi:hypothetical protein